jgi:hypothetical protein
MKISLFSLFAAILSVAHHVDLVKAGPIMAGSGVALCYTACNTGYVTCLAASGIVAGTTGPVGWYAWATSAPVGCSAGE